MLFYVDVELGRYLNVKKGQTYDRVLLYVDVELGRYLNIKKGRMINCYFVWMWNLGRDKWAPVTTAWRILRLWMEERLPMWRVAANILNK